MNFQRKEIFPLKLESLMKSETIYKCAAAISVTTTAGFGIILSWTSPALPHLTSPKSNSSVTKTEGAFIASVLGCGIIFGFIVNPIFINRLGAKRTLLILAAPQILSWITIYLGRNWIVLCIARIVSGFGYGAGMCSTTIYLTEIGDEKTRGAFLSLIKLSINIGIFVMMAFGAFLSYDVMNLVLIIIPLAFVVTFFSMPDKKEIREDDLSSDGSSHCNTIPEVEDNLNQHWNNYNYSHHQLDVLVEKENNFVEHLNNFTESGNNSPGNTNGPKLITPSFRNERPKIVKKLKRTKAEEMVANGNGNYSKREAIQEEVSKLLSSASPQPSERESLKNVWWKLFVLKNNRKALMIVLIAGLTDILSGHMAITAYAQEIFGYSGASLGPEYSALILGVIKIGGSLVATVVVEKFGRRKLFLLTGILAGLSEGLVALFFLLKLYLKMDSITWLPLFGFAMYEFFGSLGPFSLYFVYQGELLSDDVVSVGVTFTNIFYEIFTIFVKLYFQRVIDVIGIYYLFFGCTMIFIFGSCIVYLIAPETRGKSKEEIRKLLS